MRLSVCGVADPNGHVLALRKGGCRGQEQNAQSGAVVRLLNIRLIGFLGLFQEPLCVDVLVSDLCDRRRGAVDRVRIGAEPLSPACAEPGCNRAACEAFRGVLLIEPGAVCAGVMTSGGGVITVIDPGAEINVLNLNQDVVGFCISRADAVVTDRFLAGQGQIIAVDRDIRIAVPENNGIAGLRADVSDHTGCGAFIQRGAVGGDLSGYGKIGDGCGGNVGKSADDTACSGKSVLEELVVVAVVCGG